MISKGVSSIKSKIFNQDKIIHGFFGRAGGVSTGIYEGLNCGFSSNDSPKNVKQNRILVANFLGVEYENLINPYQIHSNICGLIEQPFKKDGPRMDAFVTKTQGLAIAILTADCTPILFADEENSIVGAAHAGWQGAINGVIENTINCMCENGAELSKIKAAIGPCIGAKSYEVSQEYYDNFIAEDPNNCEFFKDGKQEGKYYFDLKSYCGNRLLRTGIHSYDVLPHDTYELSDDFFSNRRRNHNNETDYGRNISVISVR